MNKPYYSDFDSLTVYNYWQYLQTSDVSYLAIGGEELSNEMKKEAAEVFESLNFAAMFDEDSFQNHILKMRKEMSLHVQASQGNIAAKLTLKKLTEGLDIDKKDTNTSIWDVIVLLEYIIKVPIDPMTTPVNKFFAYKKLLRNGIHKEK